MPIKQLEDKFRFPRLGKIHLGIKDPEKGYPRQTDYFVCPPEVQAVYGPKPKVLDIMFVSDDLEQVAPQAYKAYTRQGLVCRGDGETATRLVDLDHYQQTGEPIIASVNSKRVQMMDIPCPGPDCPYYGEGKCSPMMNLQFLLPKVPGIGVWQLDTSSYISIVRVNSALRLLHQVAGRISGIMLQLTLEPIEVSPGGKKKIVYALNLRLPNIKVEDLLKGQGEFLSLGVSSPSPHELPSSVTDTGEQTSTPQVITGKLL